MYLRKRRSTRREASGRCCIAMPPSLSSCRALLVASYYSSKSYYLSYQVAGPLWLLLLDLCTSTRVEAQRTHTGLSYIKMDAMGLRRIFLTLSRVWMRQYDDRSASVAWTEVVMKQHSMNGFLLLTHRFHSYLCLFVIRSARCSSRTRSKKHPKQHIRTGA